MLDRNRPIRRWGVALIALGLSLAAVGAAQDIAAPKSPPAPPAAPPGARITDAGWFAQTERNYEPPTLGDRVTRAYVIPLQGEISETLYKTIRRKAITCRSQGAELVIFDMNTPGGRLDWMNRISDFIIEEMKDIYTIAYVNPEAISAGAVIALACDEVIMSSMGTIGDAMPVMVGPQGYVPMPDKERGKIESYTRGRLRGMAKRGGFNVALCEAMVTSTIELWLIRNRHTGEARYVDAAEWRGRVTGVPTSTSRPATPVPVSDSEWLYVVTLDGPDKPLTLDVEQAVLTGIATRRLASIDAVAEHFGVVGTPKRMVDSWSEKMVGFLTSAAVTSVLMMAGIFCIYIEMNSPGFGVGGALAIACFAVLFGSRFLMGLANWWEIALFAVGLGLIAVEVFIVPGFGVTGISGILCCIVSLLAIVIPNAPDKLPIPTTDLDWEFFSNGAMAICIGFVGGLGACMVVARFLPKIPVVNRLMLPEAPEVHEPPVTEDSPMARIAVGSVGTVEGMCRPVGKVRFGDDLLDAMTEGDAIDEGERVRVVRKEGNRLVVERTT
jgi:membrane-bound serine protease (ClpP class)